MNNSNSEGIKELRKRTPTPSIEPSSMPPSKPSSMQSMAPSSSPTTICVRSKNEDLCLRIRDGCEWT
eukprot:9327616-Ditylum_brightwellii.AAC.1